MKKQIIDLLVEKWNLSGLVNGDLVLVHSSLKRLLLILKKDFGDIVTPKLIYDSLLTAIGEEGTLMLPLYNFDFPKSKYFNILETPSQMGLLTEIGRSAPNSIRTGHPIYSFSIIGRYASQFKDIDNKSGYGSDSPFAKLKELNGKIAIIGLSDQDSMTSYHFVEEQNKVDYRYFKEFSGEYVDQSGNTTLRTYLLYVRDIEKGVKTDVNRMMERLWELGAYKGERFDQGFGMRTIDFNLFYTETEKIIQSGQAINYLYSIENN